MASYVFFRPPHARFITRLKQNLTPRTFEVPSQLPLTGGYVICPFQPSRETPLVWLEPDEINRIEVKEANALSSFFLPEDSEEEKRAYEHAFHLVSQSLQTGETRKIVLSRSQDFCFAQMKAHCAMLLFVKDCQACHCVALAGTRTNQGTDLTSWDHKNLDEQAVVSDFIRSCLSQTAEKIETSPVHSQGYRHLQHLATDFRFSLPSPEAVTRTLSLLHPTPAVCGLPRDNALATIRLAEPDARSFYAGFSGPLFLHGETRLYVSLRCMELIGDRASLYAGGGIMPESTVETEWEETRRKMATMRSLFSKP